MIFKWKCSLLNKIFFLNFFFHIELTNFCIYGGIPKGFVFIKLGMKTENWNQLLISLYFSSFKQYLGFKLVDFAQILMEW